MKQTCILVLGMHRSGTSALTGVLDLLNVYLGSELVSASSVENKKGFFENKKLLNINKALLTGAGSNWDDIFYHEDKLKNIKELDLLKETLVKEFQYSNVFAIKDPRLAFLFPIYKKILNELEIDIKVILPYRNPLEVANSLQHRNDMSMEKGMLLWAYHFLLTEQYSRNYPRVFVDFDQLLNNTEVVIQEISTQLDIDLNTPYDKNREEINTFLEAGLKHHNISMDNLSEQTPGIVKDILQLRKEFNNKPLTQKFDQLRHELFSYQKLFYNHEIITLTTQNEKLEKSLTDTQTKLQVSNSTLQKEIQTYKEQLLEQKQKLDQKIKEYKEQSDVLEQQQKELSSKDVTLIEQKETLHQYKSRLDESSLELQHNKSLINEKEKQLSLQEKRVEELEKAHKQKVQELQKANKEQDNILKSLQQQYDKKSEELRNVRFELVSVYTGKSWRLTRPLRKLMKMLRKR